jgi:uroporphyrinogen-III synthase
MARGKAIWVTRAQPGAAATAKRLEAMGFAPIVAPLLELQPIPDVAIELDGVSAIAFTSANGVNAFAERCSERSLRVFAVGEATARAAREWRFRTVLSTDGDVRALAAAVATRKRELPGAVLHPGAADPAGDLKGALAKHGIEVRSLALYTSVRAPIPQTLLDALPKLHGALLHSPKAAQALARLLKKHPARQLKVWCLSKAVARPLAKAELAQLTASPSPSEEALLSLVE